MATRDGLPWCMQQPSTVGRHDRREYAVRSTRRASGIPAGNTNAVSSRLLGIIQPAVGRLDQFCSGFHRRGANGQADADASAPELVVADGNAQIGHALVKLFG